MKTGKCPKCSGTEIYRGGKRRANGISVLNVSAFSHVWLDNYICAQCGYVESYILDGESLGTIKKKWEKISGK